MRSQGCIAAGGEVSAHCSTAARLHALWHVVQQLVPDLGGHGTHKGAEVTGSSLLLCARARVCAHAQCIEHAP